MRSRASWRAGSFDGGPAPEGATALAGRVIVQRRAGELRVFRQHDHALLSGELALAWREAENERAVSDVLVLATSLHDLSWRRADAEPRFNPGTGRPHDFLDFPRDAKFRDAAKGIGRVARLHPYAAVLVSLHYATFTGAPPWFVSREADRRRRMLGQLGLRAPGVERMGEDLALLRLFDVLSLHACLTPPGAAGSDVPSWLSGSYATPDGGRIDVRWIDGETLAATPFPFGDRPLQLRLPFRELVAERFAGAEQLRAAWHGGGRRQWRFRMVPDDG